ncbi:type II toxin-antitoxin system VapC family toxin [Deinococcus sp. AJ005]|uniref:type II toxin-antitoxin system VapC family toxin n=1 Tax=Deinococcus sp. AJ005 TaxID=2652443 RepID=UPI00125CA6D8|nr:type II toxin-antitoxin system VapC family toxin [Deinococcus sp. AJ005]QFP77191.1 type II toxin-antitoxin system VapC family toxin [Deinococcus sp. AJ005]
MISLDTNVIISALESADSRHSEALTALLREQHQGYVISPAVYSELRAGPEWSRYQNWLSLTRISVLWAMPQEVWELAGLRQGQYAQLRRAGKLPRRILPDFLIAAHAEYHGLDVIGFDRTVYDSVFTNLTLLDPTAM